MYESSVQSSLYLDAVILLLVGSVTVEFVTNCVPGHQTMTPPEFQLSSHLAYDKGFQAMRGAWHHFKMSLIDRCISQLVIIITAQSSINQYTTLHRILQYSVTIISTVCYIQTIPFGI